MVKSAEKLFGKKVLVIGGSSGIGFGTAQILLEAGAHVTIISSSADKVDKAVERLRKTSPGNVQGKVGNVREEEAFTQLLLCLSPVDHIVFSSVDCIIRGSLADTDLEQARHLFGVKFWGSVLVAKALAKYDIVRPGGSLTLMSGAAGIKPGKGAAIGGALNGGLLTLTKGLAADLANKKIRVNKVVPGLVQTELWDTLGVSREDQSKRFEAAAKELSVGFVAKGEDVAEAYLYTIRADYANGTMVVIDGGAGL